jgi:hypothetical protein
MGSGGIVPPFLTSALDKGEWSAPCLRPLYPWEKTRGIYLIGGWVAEPVWTLWRREESLIPAGNRNPAVHPVARHYTD